MYLCIQIETVRHSELFAQMDTDKKRHEIITDLLKRKENVLHFGSPLLADLLSEKKHPTMEDMVRLAVSATSSSLGLSEK